VAPQTLAVNVSGVQFKGSSELEREVEACLTRWDIDPSNLELELTESVLMEATQRHSNTLQNLRQLGTKIAIDDFGTGYSSLSYLSRLPINSLKIDRSFVNQLQGSAENSEIVRAVITLGASLGKQVIAEGIETEAQVQRLEQLGCGHGQGFLLAHPLSVRQVGALLVSLSVEPGEQAPPPAPRAPDAPMALLCAAASLERID